MKRIFLAFLLLLFLSPAGAQASEQQIRVIGGTEATGDSWPSQVALLDASVPSASNAWFCGGTLIARRWVLTAAHCVVNLENGNTYPPYFIDILLGRKNLAASGGERVAVDRIIPSPLYDYTNVASLGDIALMKLEEASARPVMRIGRPDEAAAWATGQTVSTAGYGADSATLISEDPRDIEYTFPNKLLEADLLVRSWASCDLAYGPGVIVNGKMICASEAGRDACVGDSGGPLAAQVGGESVLVGAVSFGTDTCDSALGPGVYTRLTAYRNWIGSYLVTSLQAPSKKQIRKTRRGKSSFTKITLTNTSTLPAYLRKRTLSGSRFFAIASSNCPKNLESGASCFVKIRFRPHQRGLFRTTLKVSSAEAALAKTAISARAR